jgi:predicted acyl esterase
LPRNQALYVTMRDGVRIAIDIWLPTSLEPGQTIAVQRNHSHASRIELPVRMR